MQHKFVGFVDSAFHDETDIRDDDEAEVDDLDFRNTQEQTFQWYQSPSLPISFAKLNRLYGLLGLICIILASIGVIMGITKLRDVENNERALRSPHKRSDLYVETNFSSLLLYYVGIDALIKFWTGAYGQRTTITFTVLFLSFGYQICGSFAQITNLKISFDDDNIIRSIFALIYHLISGPICACLIILHAKMNHLLDVGNILNSAPRSSTLNESGRDTLFALLAFLQLILSFSAGIMFLRSEIEHERSLKISDEIGNSYWILFSAAWSLLLTIFYKNDRSATNNNNWSEKTAVVLQGLALLTAIKPIIIPMENLYVFHDDKAMDHTLSKILIILNGSSFISATLIFVLLVFDRPNNDPTQLKNLINHEWPILKHTCLWQALILASSLIIFFIGFSGRKLFVTNFTPLPFLILLHLVASFKLFRSPNPGFFLINMVLVVSCGIFSFRDIYLFNYHVAKGARASDTVSNFMNEIKSGSNKSGLLSENDKTILNVCIVVVTLTELLLCVSLIAAYLRTSFEYFVFLYNKNRYFLNVKIVALCATCQTVCAFLLMIFGFVTFLSNSFTAEIYGDHSIYLGIFSILASIFNLLTLKFQNFLPYALIMQVIAVFATYQFVDFGAFCLRNLLIEANRNNFSTTADSYGREPYSNAIDLAAFSFVLIIVESLLGFINIVVLNDIVESGCYKIKPQPTILSTYE